MTRYSRRSAALIAFSACVGVGAAAADSGWTQPVQNVALYAGIGEELIAFSVDVDRATLIRRASVTAARKRATEVRLNRDPPSGPEII